MTRSNELYNKVASFLNVNEVTAQEVNHILVLLRAQLPHADQSILEAFRHSDAISMSDVGSPLERVEGLIDPDPHSGVTITPKSIQWQETPVEADRPVVVFRPHGEGVYLLDPYNTNVLCKFHEKMTPDATSLKKHPEQVLRIHYGHVVGGFDVAFQPDGHSLVSFHGEFNTNSFIPIRVQVDEVT